MGFLRPFNASAVNASTSLCALCVLLQAADRSFTPRHDFASVAVFRPRRFDDLDGLLRFHLS